MSVRMVKLAQVAEINPRFRNGMSGDDEQVAFVPMAAVSAETACIEVVETRLLSTVLAGFTYFQDGDVLLAKITPCFENGKIAQARIIQRHGFGSTEFHVIRVNESQLDARYLLHFLRQPAIRIDGERKMTGSAGQRRVPKHFVEDLDIPLLPLSEQQRIAAILDQAEALRAKRRQALTKLDALTQSLFLDLFGDLSTNPKQWPVEEIGSAVRVDGGFAFKSDDFAGEGRGIVRISNLVDGRVDLADIARIPAGKIGKGERFKVFPGDILIAMSGATTGKIGVVPTDLEETLYQNQRVGNFRITDDTKIRREFLLALLGSGFYQRSLWQFAAGVAQPNVSSKQLESVPVFFPPMELQNTFGAQINVIERLKTAQQASLTKLDALFASLQHRAFRGEL